MKIVKKILIILIIIIVGKFIIVNAAPEQNDDDIANGISGTCTWVIDKDGKMTIGPTEEDECTLDNSTALNSMTYDEHRNKITSIYFMSKVNANSSISYLFANMPNLITIDLTNFDTSNTTSMNNLFHNDIIIKNIDLTPLNTNNVTNLSSMFYECNNLEELIINTLNASNVTNMSNLFRGCKNIINLNLSNFDTSNVIYMSNMFYDCIKLNELNISSFNTSNVTNMENMFYRCNSLKIINLSNFNTENVINMSNMFYECIDLTELNISSFNTSNVTNMTSMFYKCNSLETINLSNFNTEKVTTMASMFRECLSLHQIDLSNFNTSNVTNMSNMFYKSSSLETINLTSFNTEKVTTMSNMFRECLSLKQIDLSNFNTPKLTTISNLFYKDSNLEKVNLSNFITTNVTTMSGVFYECKKIESINLSNFNTENTTTMANLFKDCSNLKELDISNFDTSKVTNMLNMFLNNNSLITIKIGNKTNFYVDKNFGSTFGRGTWKNNITNEEISAAKIHRDSLENKAEGSYTKITNISKEMEINFPVDFKIGKTTHIDEFSTDREDIYQFIDNKHVVTSIPLDDIEEYVLPGKVQLLYKDVVSDKYGNNYDLKLTIDNIHIFDIKPVEGMDHVITPIIKIVNGSSLGYYNYYYVDIENFLNGTHMNVNGGNVSRIMDIKTEILNKDGTHAHGNYIFSAYDLDVASIRDVDSEYKNYDGTKGYNNYSEGINFLSGYDLNNLKTIEKTSLIKLNGNRITGTRSDEKTEFSEFLIKTESNESKHQWTIGSNGATFLYNYYQPRNIKISNIDQLGNYIKGTKLELQYWDKTIDSWTSGDEEKEFWLLPGKYTLKQSSVPNNYLISNDITFFVEIEDKIIENGDEINKVVMVNDLKYPNKNPPTYNNILLLIIFIVAVTTTNLYKKNISKKEVI